MKGIPFKPEMIKAIVEGRKTQTRRAIKPQPPNYWDETPYLIEATGFMCFHGHDGWGYKKPRYQVGEVVYIKEAIHRFNLEYASYDLDYTPVMFFQSANRFHWRWTRDKLSPMFLPYEAARYFIQITDARAERLQEITPQDCKAEGIDPCPTTMLLYRYRVLWDSINKPPYDWASNPRVWRYNFSLFLEGIIR